METFFILSFCLMPARSVVVVWKRDSTDDGLLFLPWNFSPSLLLCPVECMTVPFFGVRRGPDTIYLMLVTQHSGTVCPARLLYYFQCLPSAAPDPSIFSFYLLSFSPCLFFLVLREKKIYSIPFFWVKGIHCFQPRAYAAPLCSLSSCKNAFPTNVVHFSSTLFLFFFFFFRGVSERVVTRPDDWVASATGTSAFHLMDASRGEVGDDLPPLWRASKPIETGPLATAAVAASPRRSNTAGQQLQC